MKLVGTIDPKKVWKCSPELASATTSITSQVSTIQTAPEIIKEINDRVARIEEGFRIHGISGTFKGDENMEKMTYKGEPIVDISPGAREAHMRFMDNVVSIIRPREMGITHESLADGVTIEIKCDEIQTRKLYDTYDVRIYNQRPADFELDLVSDGFTNPKIKKDGKWHDLAPKKVIFNGPATTILWKDGTKTTVKCQDEDVWADDVGIAMCYLKKMLGNKGNFNNIFREAKKVRG